MSSPDQPSSPVARTAALSAEQRAALIAQLAERLATVPPDPVPAARRAQQSADSSDRSSPSGTGSRPVPSGRGSRWSAPSRSAAPTAIGASGTEGAGARRRPDGGHPEDAPGDPATLARQICLRQLAAAAKPRAALAEALRRRGIPDDVAASVLDRFTEVGLIDDEAYAAAYVSTKQRDRSLGARALRMELRRKGLDDGVVSGAVADIDDGDERERAATLIARRVDAAMAAGPVAARRRLVALLARRGYSSGLAHAVVSEALDSYDDPAGMSTDEAGGPDASRTVARRADADERLDQHDDDVLGTDDPDIDLNGDPAELDPDADPDSGGDRARPRSRWPRRGLRSR